MAERGTTRQIHFAAQEIQALYTVATLMNRIQTIVPIVPLNWVLTGITVTTQYLYGVLVGLQCVFRGPGLGDWR
jgi:hypothetical protein